MEDTLLTEGALSELVYGQDVDDPVLVQVLGSLKLDGIVKGHERYRLVISDGRHVISRVVTAVKLNDRGTTAPPERFSVIHVKEFFTMLVPRPGVVRLILFLTDIQVVFSAGEIKERIGCPSALFDEDVLIESEDTLLPWAEPVFESASTVDMTMTSLSVPLIPTQLSKGAIQAPLPVVQTLAEKKLQPVRALASACVPRTRTFSAPKRLKLSNASTVHTVGLSTLLSPVSAHVKQPIPLVKPPCTPVTKPVVQALAETKLQPVRALASACVPRTSTFSAPKRLKMSNASTAHSVGWSTQLSPVSAHVKQPIPLVKPPCTPVVQALAETKLQPVRALASTCVPSSNTYSAPKRLKLSNASTVHTVGCSTKLSPVTQPIPLVKPPCTPVVQALAGTKMQPVRALASTCVPSTSTYSAPKRLKLSNASTAHTVGCSTKLSPVTQPIPLVKPPCTPAVHLTHTATPTLMVKPSTVHTPAAPTPGTSFGSVMTPIAELRPTTRNWNIKARVTVKSPVKAWARGTGYSFTVDLADESGEIKATVFTEWVDKYYGMLQKDHVYYISRGNLKTANKRFNHLNHEYELIINGATSVVPCGETVAVVEAKYKFVALSEVMGCSHGSVIDVIGVCTSADKLELLNTRGGVLQKREVTLVDQTATPVVLKLWGEYASTLEPRNHPIIAIRGAMVKQYRNVINLTTLTSSVVKVNPDIAEAQLLREWYASNIKQ